MRFALRLKKKNAPPKAELILFASYASRILTQSVNISALFA